MIRLDITVDDIDSIIAAGYTAIRVYTDTSETGDFTTLDGTVTLVANQSGYSYTDLDGTSSTWYKVAYYGTVPGESDKSAARQGGTVDAYCTALDVRKELAAGATGDASIGQEHEDTIWDMCVQASRLIDRLKRVDDGAYLASASVTRYYAGSGRTRQRIEPCLSISEVAVEETDGTYTVWAATDYFTWPYNAPQGDEPITALEVNLKSDGSKSVFTAGQRRVRVTGVFGVTSTPPETVQRACRIQAARWYKRAQQAWEDLGATLELGQLEFVKELDPDVQVTLRATWPHTGAGI